MKEYEYSYKVKDINPFIDYCRTNNCEEEILKQKRVLYKNSKGVLARITIDSKQGQETTYFDFKEDSDCKKSFKEVYESPKIEVTEENKEFINSIIEIFKFEKFVELDRTRYVFEKDDITFEIDDYTNPKMKVFAIEGKKEIVENTNKELKDLIEKYKE